MKRQVPSMSSLAAEGCLLFTYNKTLDWILKKPVEERDALIRSCQRQTPQMKATFDDRKRKLEAELEARMRQQQEERAAKEARELSDRMALISKVESAGGLWMSSAQMEEALATMKSANRGEAKRKCMDALIAQMMFRKKILLQPSDSARDICFSENGQVFNEAELRKKLNSLINRRVEIPR